MCKVMFVLLFALSVYQAYAEQVPFMPCRSGNSVLAVVIEPCQSVESEGWLTCVFQHGTTVQVEAAILAPFSALQLETVASATINEHVVPFINSGSNACFENVTPSCPVHEGHFYIFKFKFDVLKYYPTGSMEIGFAIKDRSSKETLACVKVPVIVKRNPALTYNN